MQPAATQTFVTIWYEPRATIRRIVDTDPRTGVITIVALATLLGSLGQLAVGNPVAFDIGPHDIHLFEYRTWRLLNLAMVGLGPWLAIAMLYLNGAVIRWAGGLLGGTARSFEVRAALAWSIIPSIAASVVFLGAAILGFVPPLHMPEAGDRMALFHASFHSWMTPVAVVTLPLGIWALVVRLKCIGEVHHFSAWRALAAEVVSWLSGIAAGFLFALLVPLLLVALGLNFH